MQMERVRKCYFFQKHIIMVMFKNKTKNIYTPIM